MGSGRRSAPQFLTMKCEEAFGRGAVLLSLLMSRGNGDIVVSTSTSVAFVGTGYVREATRARRPAATRAGHLAANRASTAWKNRYVQLLLPTRQSLSCWMGVADGDANGGGCDGREVGSTSKAGGVGRLRTHSKPEQKEWIADNEIGGLSRGSFVKATAGSAVALLALSLVRRRFGQLLGTEGFILSFLVFTCADPVLCILLQAFHLQKRLAGRGAPILCTVPSDA